MPEVEEGKIPIEELLGDLPLHVVSLLELVHGHDPEAYEFLIKHFDPLLLQPAGEEPDIDYPVLELINAFNWSRCNQFPDTGRFTSMYWSQLHDHFYITKAYDQKAREVEEEYYA